MRRAADFLAANLCIASALALSFAGALLLSSVTRNAVALSAVPLLHAALAVTLAAVALRPDVTWSRIGLGRKPAPGLLWGAALGAASAVVPALAAVALGWAAWTPPDPSAVRFDWRETRLAGLALLAAGAAGEELAFRGVALRLLVRAAGPAPAVAATSAVFAWLHGLNPGLTPLAQANTALFGAAFATAALRRRSLWTAIGLHFGWNAAQAGLGANTSGIAIRLTGLNLELGGPRWLTGGDYGLEGGALATGAAAALVAGFALLPPRKGGPHRGRRQGLLERPRPPRGDGPPRIVSRGLEHGRSVRKRFWRLLGRRYSRNGADSGRFRKRSRRAERAKGRRLRRTLQRIDAVCRSPNCSPALPVRPRTAD